jgi:uncharacterized surface protein with fasciclin (FAS1) repeats
MAIPTLMGISAMVDLVETMQQASSLRTFVDAINTAGIADTLQGQGPFTVFAPANEAFAKLPKDALDGLLHDPSRLAVFLSTHIVPGKITTTEAKALASLASLSGQRIAVGHDGSVTVNNAKVVQADVATDNGILHIVDTVLIPV